MYYIIENEEQLDKFSGYDLSNSFIEFIQMDPNLHPVEDDISLVFIKPKRSKRGFILPINHLDCFSLDRELIFNLIDKKVEKITCFDSKRLLHFYDTEKPLDCIKTNYWLSDDKVLDLKEFDTPAHLHYKKLFYSKPNLNTIIPVSKHAEKWNQISNLCEKMNHSISHHFYSNEVSKVFNKIEKAGIRFDDELVFTNYNIFTSTGRPSNTGAGVNFAALNKDGGIRDKIKPQNDILIEMDFNAYHPRILSELVNYHIPSDLDIYDYLAETKYFKGQVITKELHQKSKDLTFKYLYTDLSSDDDEDGFIKEVHLLKNKLWINNKRSGFVRSPLSGRKIRGINSKTQVLPYILQSFETERNVMVIKKILELLEGCRTKLILYTYDSFLFDFSRNDGKELLENLEKCMKEGNYPVSVSYGKSYGKMLKL